MFFKARAQKMCDEVIRKFGHESEEAKIITEFYEIIEEGKGFGDTMNNVIFTMTYKTLMV